MKMHDKDCQGYEDCRCFHVSISKERNAAFIEVAEAATRYRQTIRDGELATGRRQRNDADVLDDALARLEKTK